MLLRPSLPLEFPMTFHEAQFGEYGCPPSEFQTLYVAISEGSHVAHVAISRSVKITLWESGFITAMTGPYTATGVNRMAEKSSETETLCCLHCSQCAHQFENEHIEFFSAF